MKRHSICRLTALLLLALVVASGCKKEMNATEVLPDVSKNASRKTHFDTIPLSTSPSARGFYEEKTTMLFGNAQTDGTIYPYRQFIAGRWTVKGIWYTYRSIFFTTLPIASGDPNILKSAKLVLFSDPHPVGNGDQVHANSGTSNAFYIRRVTSSLNITTINQFNWFNQPTVTTVNQVLVPHTNQPFQDLQIDLTAMMKQVIAEGPTIGALGLMAQLQNETNSYNIRIFCSTDQPDASRKPYLVLEYYDM
ncbi:hypothetical protein [Chitinophaga solisilvae]|uniref:hypothetical protein n=1 Tax=Chitinophaga solisilvae TaxID=1233460 RepID=UPI00137038E0|nr:hypothetical protein [Chitinophaga solisilvae]